VYRWMIAEDDAGIAEGIRRQAEMWDYQVHIVEDFRRVTEEFEAFQPHIVLLDVLLPYKSGYYWCEQLRKQSRVPILFLSSAADNMNIIMAMNAGADDFIPKPFDGSVLIAKVQALLRRSYDFAGELQLLEHKGVSLNTADNTALYDGKAVPLSKNEYRILLCLMENRGRVVSREKLMDKLWQTDVFVDDNTLTVNVNRLRKKLEAAGVENFITTRFGLGYIVE